MATNSVSAAVPLTDAELCEPGCARQLLGSLVAARPPHRGHHAGLNPHDLAALDAAGVRETRAAGMRVVASDPGCLPLLVVVLRGAVALGREVGDQRVVTEVVGPAAVVAGGTAADARALTPVEVLTVAADAFGMHVRRSPRTATAVVAALMQRLEVADAERAAAAQLATPERVAGALIRLCETFGRATCDGIVIDLPLTQDELGGLACASRKTTASALRQLRALGAVTTSRRRIVVRDAGALRRLSRHVPSTPSYRKDHS